MHGHPCPAHTSDLALAMTTGAEAVASLLLRLRIAPVVGIVGVPVTPIAVALQAAGGAFFSFRNEQSASYAASAAGYLSGRSVTRFNSFPLGLSIRLNTVVFSARTDLPVASPSPDQDWCTRSPACCTRRAISGRCWWSLLGVTRRTEVAAVFKRLPSRSSPAR